MVLLNWCVLLRFSKSFYIIFVCMFFFKQKTAYEMRISDWSSDVCSSDLDPPASAHGDACGIVVVGLGEDRRAYVIADATVEGATPEGWARAVAAAALVHGADRVVAEANNGWADRKSVVSGKVVSVRVDLGGSRLLQKKKYITLMVVNK